MIDKKTIAGKNVYIFESHEMAFAAWGEIANELKEAPILLTLDHHTDTHEAFLKHYYEKHGLESSLEYNEGEHAQLIRDLLSKTDIKEPISRYETAQKLHNDEQIAASIQKGIIAAAFVVSYDSMGTPSLEEDKYQEENVRNLNFIRIAIEGKETPPYPERPYTYSVPENKIFEIDENEGKLEEDSEKDHFDRAIESSYLDKKIAVAEEMAKSIGITDILASKFILDIDLDYFLTKKSISPDDVKTFYRIVKAAAAITIAKEPTFVESLKYPGEDISSDFLLHRLLLLIENAAD
jgi:hypothetical protein